MIFLITVGVGLILLILFRVWKNRQIDSVYQNEVSHFSNIGFNNMMDETEVQTWLEKAKTNGETKGSWFLLSGESGEQLWVANPESKQYEIQPFFKGNSFPVESVEFFKLNDFEGLQLVKLHDDISAFAELIPYEENSNHPLYLTAFGVMITLYDSESQYENLVKSKFKKQLISLAYIDYSTNPENMQPSAECILSGIILEHERKVNKLTNGVYWHVAIDAGNGIILDGVWDYRLADRFPQKGNVIVGNFYLFGSYQMTEVL